MLMKKQSGRSSCVGGAHLTDACLLTGLLGYFIQHGLRHGLTETPTGSLASANPAPVGIAAQRTFCRIHGIDHTEILSISSRTDRAATISSLILQ
jgi:hypothetical protein